MMEALSIFLDGTLINDGLVIKNLSPWNVIAPGERLLREWFTAQQEMCNMVANACFTRGVAWLLSEDNECG